MKKIMALILVLAMVAVAFGCAAKPAETESTTPAPAPEQTTTDSTTSDAAPAGDAAVEEAETYTVCLLLPYSGVYANIATMMDLGATYCLQYFLEELGGFQSKNVNIEFLKLDLENDADLAVSLYEKNVGDFDACMGCYKTAATIACGNLATRYQKPFLNIFNTSDSTTQDPSDYVFKVCLGESEASASIASSFTFLESKDDHKYSKIATIYGNDDFNAALTVSFEPLWADLGWEIVVKDSVQTNNTTDLSSSINKVKNSGADMVCPVFSTAEAILFTKQAVEYKLEVPAYGNGGGFQDSAFLGSVNGAADYLVVGGMWAYDVIANDPVAVKIHDGIVADAGFGFSETAVFAWKTMAVLLQGIENAASLAADDVCAAIDALDLDGDHFSCLLSKFPGVKFEDAPGTNAIAIRYNQNVRGAYVFNQCHDDYWYFVYSPATGEPENSRLVWPHPLGRVG